MPRIFVSYANLDLATVRDEIVPLLESLGVETWVAYRDIPAGQDYAKAISQGLAGSDWFMVVVSKASSKSPWVQDEVAWAVDRREGRIIPLLLEEDAEPTDLHFRLGPIQHLTHDAAEGRLQLDLKALLQTGLAEPVSIAFLGAKGGVGKTTLAQTMAQIIAEGRKTVAIVDLDLFDVGATAEAKRRFPSRSFTVRTTFDHVSVRSSAGDSSSAKLLDDRLCNITPQELQTRKLGSIWLVPSRHRQRNRQPFEMLIKLGRSDYTPSVFREVIRELKIRIKQQLREVDAIIFDCGAGRSTLFAAAIAESDVCYVVANPNSAYFTNIHESREEALSLFPDAGASDIHVIINRVSSQQEQSLCESLDPVAYIPTDPTIEQGANLLGSVDFGVGYNEVFVAVWSMMSHTFPEFARELIPDEVEVRVKPWFRLLVEKGIASSKLRTRSFRAMFYGPPIAAIVLLLAIAWLLFSELTDESSAHAELAATSIWQLIFLTSAMVATIASWALLALPRYRVLKRLSSSSARPDEIDDSLRVSLETLGYHQQASGPRKVKESLVNWLKQVVDAHHGLHHRAQSH